MVGPQLPCGERDGVDRPRERHLRIDRDAHHQLTRIDTRVKKLVRMLNVANVLRN